MLTVSEFWTRDISIVFEQLLQNVPVPVGLDDERKIENTLSSKRYYS